MEPGLLHCRQILERSEPPGKPVFYGYVQLIFLSEHSCYKPEISFKRGICAAASSMLSASLIWYRVLNLNHLQELAGAQSEELSTAQARNFCMQPQWQILLKTGLQPSFPSPFQKGCKSLIWKRMSNPQVPFFYLIYPTRPRVFCFNVWWIPYAWPRCVKLYPTSHP